MSQNDIIKSPSFMGRAAGLEYAEAPSMNNSFHEESFQDQSKANDLDYYNVFANRENEDIFEFTFANSFGMVCLNTAVSLFSATFLIVNCFAEDSSQEPLYFASTILGTLLELALVFFSCIEFLRPGILATKIYYSLCWWLSLLINMTLLYATHLGSAPMRISKYCCFKNIDLLVKIIEAMIQKLIISTSSKE